MLHFNWPGLLTCSHSDGSWTESRPRIVSQRKLGVLFLEEGRMDTVQEKRWVAHHANPSERGSGENRYTKCHIHSPSKLGAENLGMRILEGPYKLWRPVMRKHVLASSFKLSSDEWPWMPLSEMKLEDLEPSLPSPLNHPLTHRNALTALGGFCGLSKSRYENFWACPKP